MKFKIGEAIYDMAENLTFGEEADIAREFGNAGDRGFTLGVFWISVRRVRPTTTVDDLSDAVIELVEEPIDKLPPTSEPETGSDEA